MAFTVVASARPVVAKAVSTRKAVAPKAAQQQQKVGPGLADFLQRVVAAGTRFTCRARWYQLPCCLCRPTRDASCRRMLMSGRAVRRAV